MRGKIVIATTLIGGLFAASAAMAECSGSNGRGWGKGQGKGQFEMTQADKSCVISYPGFINEEKKTRVPATDVTFSKVPKSGKLALSKSGIVYTPAAGFKGKEQFCLKATAKGEKGSLSGCVTVVVK